MAILFNQAITAISVHPNRKPNCLECSYAIEANYKRRIGYKYGIIPVYETISEAVVEVGIFSGSTTYVCELKDFDSKYYYFKDGEIYKKPHCIIYMNDKSSREVYFETADELNKYVEEIKSKAPHIEV